MAKETAFIYFITNWNNKVLYIGVTTDLQRRLFEHKTKLRKGFAAKYNLTKLIYYEQCSDISDAISREKQLKGWTRIKKNDLVNRMNPAWADLSDDWKS